MQPTSNKNIKINNIIGATLGCSIHNHTIQKAVHINNQAINIAINNFIFL